MVTAQRSLAVVLATSVVFSTSGWTGWSGTAGAAGPRGVAGAPAMLAPAASAKLAILPLTVEGGISESDQAELTKALTAGLERGSFQIVGPEGVLAADPKAGACNNVVCYQNIARRTGAAYVVRA